MMSMRWLWQREVRLKDSERIVNPRRAELETAKDILAEIY